MTQQMRWQRLRVMFQADKSELVEIVYKQNSNKISM